MGPLYERISLQPNVVKASLRMNGYFLAQILGLHLVADQWGLRPAGRPEGRSHS